MISPGKAQDNKTETVDSQLKLLISQFGDLTKLTTERD
jgi:hypothetical protein